MKTYNDAQFILLRMKSINMKDIAMLVSALLLLQVFLMIVEVTSKGILLSLLLLALVKIVQGVIDMISYWLLQDEPKNV